MSNLGIPENWAMATIGEIVDSVQYGATASSKTTGKLKLLRITDITSTGVKWESVPFCDLSLQEGEKYLLKDGDILIARTGGTVGKSFRVVNPPKDIIFASYLIRLSPKSTFRPEKFIETFLTSPGYWESIRVGAKGAAQPNVNSVTLKAIKIPLPPLGEQKRLVGKIESIQEKLKQIDFNIDQAAALIGKYRESFLQKAFRGQLVPQNLDDQPASDLLKRIHIDRNKVSASKKKKNNPPAISPDEIPFEIPKTWEWVRLGQVCRFERGHNPPKSEFKYKPQKGYVRFIQIQDFKTDDRAVYVPNTERLHLCKRGDIMVVAYRHIGRISREMEGAFNVALCKFVPNEKVLAADFLAYLTPSPLIRGVLLSKSERSMIPSMSVDEAALIPIPLPPLHEQIRIVEVVKSNFEKIENLFDGIKSASASTEHLSRSILQAAFTGALVSQMTNEGTGHDLLQKIKTAMQTKDSKRARATQKKVEKN